jgi:hypothetical protein
MSVIGSNILAGASGQGGGYNLTKSLRFRSSASAYLIELLLVQEIKKTFTFSTWVKRGGISSDQSVFLPQECRTKSKSIFSFEFTTSDTLYISFNSGSGWVALTTSSLS